MESMTSTSKGARRDSSLMPSCSSNATGREEYRGSVAAAVVGSNINGREVTVYRKLPFSLPSCSRVNLKHVLPHPVRPTNDLV